MPLNLALTVSQLKDGAVSPLPNAFVYLWSANALGKYSSEEQLRTGNDTYLRGYQVTDKDGLANFLTMYPGWYGGRTIHIHARVRMYPNNDPTQKLSYDFETQFFFDDTISDHVLSTVSPYNTRNDRDTTNSNDHVYNGAALDGTHAKGSGALTKVKMIDDTSHANASFQMTVDFSKHAQSRGRGPGGPGGRPPGGFGGPPPDGGMGGPPPDGDFGGPPPNGDF